MTEAVESRLRPIVHLGELIDIEVLRAQELGAKRIHERYGIPPTIGCEIEVKWSAHFPELAREYFGEQDEYGRFERRFKDLPAERQQELDGICVELNKDLLPRYEATSAAGIPKGRDAYWEFANAPVYNWQTLATEVDLLFADRLIPEGFEHSLHVTLGGASAEGGGMCLVLSGLELTHASPERILSATMDNQYGAHSTWARRGKDGIRQRPAGTLDMGQSIGTELRTLAVASGDQARDILRDAQMITTILLAFRIRKEITDPHIQEIAELWPAYRSVLKDLWALQALPAESWGSPHRNAGIWRKWAASLVARDQPGSPEWEAVRRIREITSLAAERLNSL